MTSNQLQYWRLQEDQRANRAKEAETRRSNVTNEQIKQIQNELEAQNIKIRDKQLLLQLAEYYNQASSNEYENLPDELQTKLAQEFDVSGLGPDRKYYGSEIWYQLWDIIGHALGSRGAGTVGKVISALF